MDFIEILVGSVIIGLIGFITYKMIKSMKKTPIPPSSGGGGGGGYEEPNEDENGGDEIRVPKDNINVPQDFDTPQKPRGKK